MNLTLILFFGLKRFLLVLNIFIIVRRVREFNFDVDLAKKFPANINKAAVNCASRPSARILIGAALDTRKVRFRKYINIRRSLHTNSCHKVL